MGTYDLYYAHATDVLFFSINAKNVATFPVRMTHTYDFLRALTITTALCHIAEKLA